MVMEGHLFHKNVFVDWLPMGMDEMNVPERVYGLHVLTIGR